MANALLGTPNFSDANATYTPTFSGGSWQIALTNLADRRLAKVARSNGLLTTSTQFQVDLLRPCGVRVIAIPKHTMSLVARIRVRGSTTAGVFTSPVYDTGWLNVFPVVYQSGTLYYGHPSFWTGQVNPEDQQGVNIGWIHVTPQLAIARYWLVEIDDTTNSDGFIDLARLFLAGGYQPTINMEYGAKLGLESESTRSVTDGGAAVYQDKPRRRNVVGVFGHLPEYEGLTDPFEIQRKLGTTGQLYWVWDSADTYHWHRRAFCGVFRELSALDFPYYARNAWPFSIVEEL